MTNVKYTQTRNSIALILFSILAVILAMTFNSCAGGTKSTKGSGPCPLNKNYVGYGYR